MSTEFFGIELPHHLASIKLPRAESTVLPRAASVTV